MKCSTLVALLFSFLLSTAYAASTSLQADMAQDSEAQKNEVVDGSNIVDTGGSLSVVSDQEAQELQQERQAAEERARQNRMRQQQAEETPPTGGGQQIPRPGQPESVSSSYGNPVSGPNPQAQGTPEVPANTDNN